MVTRARALVVGVALMGAAWGWHSSPSAAQTTTVAPGGDLQAALDRARAGDTLLLAPGATYTGNFVLPARAGDAFINLRTAPDARHPQPGQRVLPVHEPRLAKLKSPNNQPALRTAPGAHHWRVQLVDFPGTLTGAGDIVALGDGSAEQSSLSGVPHDLILDRCYIHGDVARGQKRGIALNSASTTITGSYVSEIKLAGQDSQAIASWNGPGPYTIENNYLEAAGENVLFGGADPAIPGLVAQDVVVRGNLLSKPVAWRTAGWQVKNLFELKNARRVLVEANVMEYAWLDAQVGYAILLTPRNQDGRAPWSVVEDVTIRRNVIRHAGGALTITGEDSNHPSGSTRRVSVTENLIYGIDAAAWGGSGAFLLIGDEPSDITIAHNTVSQSGNIVMAFGGTRTAPRPVRGFVFENNLIAHNAFGVIGSDQAIGAGTLAAYFPDAVFRGNTIGGGDASRYPAGNQFISRAAFEASFVAPARGDYRLTAASPARGAGSDRRDAGADIRALALALGSRTR